MDRDERYDELAGIRAATEALEPSDEITNAILATAVRPADDALSDLAESTSALDATPAFADAVMLRVKRAAPREPSWTEDVVRTGPIALGLAALVTAASFALFFMSRTDVDATVATSLDAVEVVE